jgi:hypothetical protein
MSDQKKYSEQRPVIYPHNFEKVEGLLRASNLQNATQLINYLIENVEIEQLTKITVTNERTKKSFSVVKVSNGYNPKTW